MGSNYEYYKLYPSGYRSPLVYYIQKIGITLSVIGMVGRHLFLNVCMGRTAFGGSRKEEEDGRVHRGAAGALGRYAERKQKNKMCGEKLKRKKENQESEW